MNASIFLFSFYLKTLQLLSTTRIYYFSYLTRLYNFLIFHSTLIYNLPFYNLFSIYQALRTSFILPYITYPYFFSIIEPLASRCAKFRFKPVATEQATDRLRSILDQENVLYHPDTLPRVLALAEGDLRQAITLLQSAHRLHPQQELSPAFLEEMSGVRFTPTKQHPLMIPRSFLNRRWTVWNRPVLNNGP